MSKTNILILLATAIGTPAYAETATPPAVASGGTPPYTVVDGNKVDPNTLEGWHTWRALACDRCHGARQEGSTGPSLIDSLQHMTKDQFKSAVLDGRPDKGMPYYYGSKMVVENIDNLYIYLKGRSDGAISSGHLYLIGK